MAIVFTCACGKLLKAKPEASGKRTRCPDCGAVIQTPGKAGVGASVSAGGLDRPSSVSDLPANALAGGLHSTAGEAVLSDAIPLAIGDEAWETLSLEPASSQPSMPVHTRSEGPPSPARESARRYKVLTQRDMGFAVKFDSVKLEETLNSLSREGWAVKAAVTLTMSSHAGPHDELVLILERGGALEGFDLS